MWRRYVRALSITRCSNCFSQRPAMEAYVGNVWVVRLLVQRAMAALYLIAFICAFNQFKALVGEHGLLPVPAFLKRAEFREAPSIFHWRYSDRMLDVVVWAGILLSAAALTGLSEAGPFVVSMIT